MNEFIFSDIEVGMSASFKKKVTPEMENVFREISGDQNPLHQDDEFAKEVSNGKYSSHVCFGMLTASLYSTLAGVYIPGKYSLIHSFDELSFIKPVFIGDDLCVGGVVSDMDAGLHLIKVKAQIRNQNKELVSRAKMKILVLK